MAPPSPLRPRGDWVGGEYVVYSVAARQTVGGRGGRLNRRTCILKGLNCAHKAQYAVGLWRSQVALRTFNPAVKGSNPFRPAFIICGLVLTRSLPPDSVPVNVQIQGKLKFNLLVEFEFGPIRTLQDTDSRRLQVLGMLICKTSSL